ncbi:hypothetical protein HJD18_00515 [Thermoleophilia bacterium SCSIO 60948]|nr:hypothetical protein HJD18_00515 [Thermoleophilia bacterium SCSIO 60948]
MGRAVIREATIPDGEFDLPAVVMAPADRERYPGPRPVVTFGHGISSQLCNVFWLQRYLAGHGYVAIAYSAPQRDGLSSLPRSVEAMRAAVRFASDPANPLADRIDPRRIGIGGFSLGAHTASIVQADPGIDAVVLLDNLRRWRHGDPGGVGGNCVGPPAHEIPVGAPALGLAQDAPCKARPRFQPRDLKQFGFDHWREQGVASMELVLRGFDHVEFGNAGSDRQRRLVAHYTGLWFDRWLADDPEAESRLLAPRAVGLPVEAMLSRRFDSAAYLPGRIETTRLRD